MRPSHRLSRHLAAAWAVAGIFGWLAASAWFRPLMAPDEGRYAGVAYEMLRSGDWLVPRLDGMPFFHKPPLFYWIGAAAMAVFGSTEWAARLPSLLGATLAAAALFAFLRRWADGATARLALAVLLTMPFFYLGAQFANLDMLVAGCIGATVLLAAHAALSAEQGAAWRAALAGAFACAALGFLAKGLIGFVLPGLIFVVWCGITRRLRAVPRMAAWLPGWLLFAAIAGPWCVAMQLRYADFFDYFIVTQHFRRFAGSGFNNEHPFWFYLPVIAGLTLPWFGWLAAARRRMPGAAPRLSDIDWLLVVWCACIVLFFSAPRSKLVGYVLPALPPLAALIARVALAAVGRSKQPQRALRALRWTGAVSALVCLGGVGIAARMGLPPSTGLRLPAGSAVGPQDPVLMLDAYDYGLPMRWKLQRPVQVSGDWRAEVVSAHDNWRKELYDASRFGQGDEAGVLVDTAALGRVLCVPHATWLVGPSNAQLAHPWLARVRLVAYSPQAAVWRFAGSAAGDAHCLEAAGPAPSP